MVLLFLFLNLPLLVFAQGSLEGKVIDEETNSVIGLANIKINRQDSKEYLQTQSEISGIYKFHNLESGLYEVSVTCMGYENYTNKIMIEASKIKEYTDI